MNTVVAVGVVTVTETHTRREVEVDGEDLVWTQRLSPADVGVLHTGKFNLGGNEAHLKLTVVETYDENLRDVVLTVPRDFTLVGDFDMELVVEDLKPDPDDV